MHIQTNKPFRFTGQAPYVVKQFQRFGLLDVNIINDGGIMKGTFYEIEMAQAKDHFTITKYFYCYC